MCGPFGLNRGNHGNHSTAELASEPIRANAEDTGSRAEHAGTWTDAATAARVTRTREEVGRLGGSASGLRRHQASLRASSEQFERWIAEAKIPPFMRVKVLALMRKAFGHGARKAYRTGYKQAFNRYGKHGGPTTMKPEQAPGQQKPHDATRTNPTTGEIENRTFTQEEWRNRDKAEGWTRPDGEEIDGSEPNPGDAPEAPDTPEGSTPA